MTGNSARQPSGFDANFSNYQPLQTIKYPFIDTELGLGLHYLDFYCIIRTENKSDGFIRKRENVHLPPGFCGCGQDIKKNRTKFFRRQPARHSDYRMTSVLKGTIGIILRIMPGQYQDESQTTEYRIDVVKPFSSPSKPTI